MKKQRKTITFIFIIGIIAILCIIVLMITNNIQNRLLDSNSTYNNGSSNIDTVSEDKNVIEESQTSSQEDSFSGLQTPSSTNSSVTTSSDSSTVINTSSTTSKPTSNADNNNSSVESTTTSGGNTGTTSKPVIVQRADTNTGISWDGVSPIIYTYPDGSTGTEKRDGATYEYLPGMIQTYKIERDLTGREVGSICLSCKKAVGRLSKGLYCKRVNIAVYCTECGAFIPAFKCHTCYNGEDNLFYCEKCGKIMGDGTDETCLSYWTGGEHDCPNCGDTIPVRTCHTCKR